MVTKDALYAKATELEVDGRSQMTKAELAEALVDAGALVFAGPDDDEDPEAPDTRPAVPDTDDALGFMPELRRSNAPRAEVFVLQGLLRAHGYQHGALDGAYGRETVRAVQKFRADRGLAESDHVDAALWSALAVS